MPTREKTQTFLQGMSTSNAGTKNFITDVVTDLFELEAAVREWRSGGRTGFLEKRVVEAHDGLLKHGKLE